MGHRMSSLGLAAICPLAPVLNEQHGSGISALKSSVFHALCAGDPSANTRLLALPADARQEVEHWRSAAGLYGPPDIHFKAMGETVVLEYRKAEKELEVALDGDGLSCSPDDPTCVSVGHLDMAWVHQFSDGTRVAYIGDIKKSQWTSVDGPETLQCHSYGMAYASQMACDGYTCGLYIAEDGVWNWSERYIELESVEAMKLLDVIIHAATNEGQPVMGPHCQNCYGRMHCPEYMLPPTEDQMSALSRMRPGEIDNAKALEALQLTLRGRDVFKAAYDNLKVFAERNGGIYDPESNKRWRPIQCRGRESVDLARLRSELGQEAEVFVRRGAPYNQMKWSKK